MAETKKSSEGLPGILGVIVVVVVGYYFWQQAQTAGWLPHDVIALVIAKDWSTGEYRNCTEPNIEAVKDEPQLDCSNYGASGEAKRFKVSFYGDTYKEELKDKATFTWRCKKDEDTDPSFTCDEQKIVTWDQNK